MTIYSLDELLFLFGTSLLFHVQFYCCFLTCIQISQEADQVVWYSHLFQNFPQFIVIHTVKGFGIANKAKIDVFLELSCFFYDPADVCNLISGSSAFSKTRDFMTALLSRSWSFQSDKGNFIWLLKVFLSFVLYFFLPFFLHSFSLYPSFFLFCLFLLNFKCLHLKIICTQ